jgi:hypothetical protein
LAAAGSCFAFPQRREGIFVPPGATTGTAWSLNDNHTLVWGGTPYIPYGLRIDGTPEAVQQAKAAGIKDVLVDLPAGGGGWDETLAALKAADMRYLVRVNSLAPTARGFDVEPEAYRLVGLVKSRTVTIDLPDATSAFIVDASRRDSSVSSSVRLPVIDGKVTCQVKVADGAEHVLLIYPETSGIEQPDFWEDMDGERDVLLASMKRHPLGAGLRGIVNPLGRTLGLPGRKLHFVPTSLYFRLELRNLLERRYRSVTTTMRSWAMSGNSLDSFDELARLVPLWHGDRGVGLLLDPVTNHTYLCDNKRSTIWTDIVASVDEASVRRFQRFVSAIRSVADVPVVQEWAGWSAPYEGTTPTVDGVGMRVAGTRPSALNESGCRAASSVLRWKSKGWLTATDIDLGSGPGLYGLVPTVLDDLGQLGARGFFIRTDSPQVIQVLAAEAQKRSATPALANEKLQALYFPESARNPAQVQQLPGGRWWLPSPEDGNRIDLGTMFWAYRINRDGKNMTVLWAKKPGRYLLRLMRPKTVRFDAVDGHVLDPKVKKNGVEIELNEYPTVVSGTEEIPIPQLAYIESVYRFDYLSELAKKTMRDITEQLVMFKDFASGFDKNPSGTFAQMRVELARIGAKVGDVTFVEAQKSLEQNFSDTPVMPSCISGSALLLHTPLPPGPDGYFANFNLQVRTKEPQDVWLAAEIPAELRPEVQVLINGQPFSISDPPLSFYGDGFAWYKMGSTRLGGSTMKASIVVNGPGNMPIALDALVLTPRDFKPDGVNLPDPVKYPPFAMKGDKLLTPKNKIRPDVNGIPDPFGKGATSGSGAGSGSGGTGN